VLGEVRSFLARRDRRKLIAPAERRHSRRGRRDGVAGAATAVAQLDSARRVSMSPARTAGGPMSDQAASPMGNKRFGITSQ
jgi:hypothetical protein